MEVDPTVIKALEKIVHWAQDLMVTQGDKPKEEAPKVEVAAMETGPGEMDEDQAEESSETPEEERDEQKSDRTILGRHLLGVGAMNTRPRENKAPVGKKRY